MNLRKERKKERKTSFSSVIFNKTKDFPLTHTHTYCKWTNHTDLMCICAVLSHVSHFSPELHTKSLTSTPNSQLTFRQSITKLICLQYCLIWSHLCESDPPTALDTVSMSHSSSYDRAAGNMFHWAQHANFTHRSRSAANPPSAQHMCVGFEGVWTWLESNYYNKSNKSQAEDAYCEMCMCHHEALLEISIRPKGGPHDYIHV